MKEFLPIQKKLQVFYKKYYTNELIKGVILFSSLGLLYFLFTLFIEYFLWLKPLYRAILFWVFIVVELLLLYYFVLLPVEKLIKIKKGLSEIQSSKIIGNYFPEVQDKLLNLLQLKNEHKESALLLASIEQKSKELQPIPFAKAVNFRKNITYTRYLVIPAIIWLVTFFSGTDEELTKSLSRVVNFKKEFIPPAPFEFSLDANNLKVIEGNPFSLEVTTTGNVVPEEVKILFGNQEYYLQERSTNIFYFTFTNVIETIDFNLEANGVHSRTYTLEVIKTPTIQNIILDLNYPKHTGKMNETQENTSNLLIPEGTTVQWKVSTKQTDSVVFIENKKRSGFSKEREDLFSFQKRVIKSTSYEIASSNTELVDFEKLPYSIKIVKDEFPSILVRSNIDSLFRGEAQFVGQISDDYGVSKLEMIYYNKATPKNKKAVLLPINKENIQTFFYQFPDQLILKEGIDYELYFQVFDNDGVNGQKKAISKRFYYRKKTVEEIDEEILQNQKKTINNLEKTIQKQQEQKKSLEEIQQEIQQKKDLNWNDKKKVNDFIKRQEQYKEMMNRQTESLQENLEEKREDSKPTKEKKEELQKRIEELKKLNKQNKLLEELKKIAEKLDKEELVRKVKQLSQQNKQKERSLERMLELTKRFYVEEKTMQIANKLEQLSKKQDSIINDQIDAAKKQEEINKQFDKITKEIDELQKDNEKLKEPMKIPDVEDESKETKKDLNKSKENIEQQKNNEAKKSQNKASKKMKQMSQQMQQAMLDMQANAIDENIDDLRKIVNNLVVFSFKQEDLMNKFNEISVKHPDFGKHLKQQHEIKTYFEHVDDSLYVLSMRLPQLSAKIQEDLSTAHYNLNQSLENFSENSFNRGLSNQQYVMTATNSLSDFLSDLLNNMQNSSSSSGKGKGSGNSFSLPALIQKQKGLSEEMKKGLQKGKSSQEEKGGENGKRGQKGKEGGNEGTSGDLFQIYKEQSALRQQLQDVLKEGKGVGENAKKVLKTMEELESEIVEKGFSLEILQRMKQLEYELLKLDQAAFEQGKDTKRKSETNSREYQKKINELKLRKSFYNQIEILNRQSLPLQESFEKIVQEYFSKKIKQ